MPSSSLANIKQTLRHPLPELREEYGVESFALFGSHVRGKAGPDSDLDVLVTFDDPPGLLAFTELEHGLRDLVGHSVDLSRSAASSPASATAWSRRPSRFDEAGLPSGLNLPSFDPPS
jgi:Predicted nucleotidyltransferases